MFRPRGPHQNLYGIIILINANFVLTDGFHKIISTTSGALDSNDNDEIEFTHPCFVRGHPYLLEQIKRKVSIFNCCVYVAFFMIARY